MNNTKTKIKKSLVIGTLAAILASSLPLSSDQTQSWFITGLFDTSSNSITVINDEDTHVEFGFGIFDIFKKLFS